MSCQLESVHRTYQVNVDNMHARFGGCGERVYSFKSDYYIEPPEEIAIVARYLTF